MKTVNLELINLALEKVDGNRFEQFANATFAALIGPEFIPLGGSKDWGADGLLSTVTYAKPHVFYQFSIEENFRDKIRSTVKRLREVGRKVNTLTYATSRIVPRLDTEEDELGDELKITGRIRDGNYLANQVNTSPAILEAYHSFLSPGIAYLSDVKTSPLFVDDDKNENAAVYVFLRNELDSREGGGGSSEGLADGLIIWALRDTGATEGKFLSTSEIGKQIEKDVPGITALIGELLPSRLRALSRIPQAQQRPIRYHAKDNSYCIAFDLRSKLRDQNLQAEALRRSVFATYQIRILEHSPKIKEDIISCVVRIAYNTIQKCLENEGFEFAAFLSGEIEDHASIKNSIDECVIEEKLSKNQHALVCALVEHVLHEAFTKPSQQERLLYSRIASAYTLLFCLRTEPKIIRHFERMAGHFDLFTGADVLVEILTERFLPPEQKLFSNTLQLIRAAGGKLILTESVLEEVQHHLHAADQEFGNHYQGSEHGITPDNLEIIDRALIRAYFQGKFSADKNRPRNWPQFLNNYCDPRAINSKKGKEDLRKYLMAKIGMEYLRYDEVQQCTKGRPVGQLASLLEPHKKTKALAWNDALMVHLIYARREANKEGDAVSGFGLRSWWLTNEYAVTRFTKKLVSAEKTGYLMRPDFLLNFLTLLPKKQQARSIYETLFPTLLGVHLAHDHSPAHIKRLHRYLQEVKAVDPARRLVLVAEKGDELKASLAKASWLGTS
jgi:hypothetical protein